MTVSILAPSLKNITVGMLLMPYSAATPGLSSVFNLNYANRKHEFSHQHQGKPGQRNAAT
jgi:hypothetical protein